MPQLTKFLFLCHEWRAHSHVGRAGTSHALWKYLGPDWLKHHDNPTLWQRLYDIPDGELWSVHVLLKNKLMGFIRERARDSGVRNSRARANSCVRRLLDQKPNDWLRLSFCYL
jgi:hypothetical protein